MKHRETLKNVVSFLLWLTASAILLGGYGILAVLPNLSIAVPEMLILTAGGGYFPCCNDLFWRKNSRRLSGHRHSYCSGRF